MIDSQKHLNTNIERQCTKSCFVAAHSLWMKILCISVLCTLSSYPVSNIKHNMSRRSSLWMDGWVTCRRYICLCIIHWFFGMYNGKGLFRSSATFLIIEQRFQNLQSSLWLNAFHASPVCVDVMWQGSRIPWSVNTKAGRRLGQVSNENGMHQGYSVWLVVYIPERDPLRGTERVACGMSAALFLFTLKYCKISHWVIAALLVFLVTGSIFVTYYKLWVFRCFRRPQLWLLRLPPPPRECMSLWFLLGAQGLLMCYIAPCVSVYPNGSVSFCNGSLLVTVGICSSNLSPGMTEFAIPSITIAKLYILFYNQVELIPLTYYGQCHSLD